MSPLTSLLAWLTRIVLLVWKGIQLEVDLKGWQIAVCVMVVPTGVVILQSIFMLPYLWRRVMAADWPLKWYMMWQGPFLLKRPKPPTPPPSVSPINIKDYYRGHLSKEELDCLRASESLLRSLKDPQSAETIQEQATLSTIATESIVTTVRPRGPWYSFRTLYWRTKRVILRGLEKDVIRMQKRSSLLNYAIEDMHARTPRYDNRAEYMYSALQILTASTASFIHGANDVSNAIAPFTSAYVTWREGVIRDEVDVPIWIL